MISVVIPTLNEGRNLQSCFDSLLNQTFKDFEVLIVDGGSHDSTVQIAERNGIPVMHVLKKRPHDVSAARNQGMRAAKGDVMVFLDADTTLSRNCFEVVSDHFRPNDVVGVSCQTFPLEGNGLEHLFYKCNNLLIDAANKLKKNQLSYFSCLAYRRAPLVRIGGFREDLQACEDLDLARRLSTYGRFVFTRETYCLTSPRRLRKWSYGGYFEKYVRYLSQYYLLGRVTEFYEDLS